MDRFLSIEQLNALLALRVYRLDSSLVDKIISQYAHLRSLGQTGDLGDAIFWEETHGFLSGDSLSSERPPSGVEDAVGQVPYSPTNSPFESQIGGGGDLPFHEVVQLKKVFNKKFKTYDMRYLLKLHEARSTDPELDMLKAFGDLIETAFVDGNLDARVGMTINHPDLVKPIGIHFQRRKDLNAEKVLNTVEKVIQSNVGVQLGHLEVHAQLYQAESAGALPQPSNKAEWFKTNRAIFDVGDSNAKKDCIVR